MSTRRRRLIFALGALILAVVALLAIAPRLIDTPAVRAEIQSRLSAALAGQVSWQALELRLLPVPHGELRDLRIEIPGKASVSAELVDVRLRIWPLLRGRTEIASVILRRPQIHVTAGEASKDQSPSDPMAAYRAVVEPLARSLQQFASDARVDVSDAEVEVRVPGEAPFVLRLRATAQGGADGLDLQLEAANGLWKRLRLEGRLDYRDFSTKLTARLEDLDLPALSKAASLERIGRLDGRVSASATVVVDKSWRADIDIVRSSATLQLAALPWPLAVREGQVALSEKQVMVQRARGTLGESTFTEVAARVELEGKPGLSAASGRATLSLEQWYPWLAQKFPLDTISALSGRLDVTLNHLALPFDRPQAIELEALVVPRATSATLPMLPGPVAIDGGAVRVDAAAVRLDKVSVAMLDTRGLVSGTIALRQPKVDLSLAEASAGERLVRWALDLSGVPAHIEPKTPVRVAARRIAWGPAGLDLDAGLEFAGGPSVGVVLGWAPKRLEVRRLAIKDARSDATLTAAVRGEVLEVGFSGLLRGETLAAMQRKSGVRTGSMQGDLRLALDRARPERTTAEGNLRVDALDLSGLAGRPALIERAELSADKTSLRIAQARVIVDEQILELSGEARNTDQGPVIDARLESPGIVLDRLLPAKEKSTAADESALWPLPVTGRVAVRAGFVQKGEHKITPFEGTLALEAERARLEVQQARMCGVSFPLQAEATPKGYSVAAQIAMKDEPFEKALHCLTGGRVQVTGSADLRAELRTQGKRDELLRNLTGTAQAELRKGRVHRFALIGNILSVQNLTSIRDPRELDQGFVYRSMTARGHFEGGGFIIEEGFFDSDAARIAVNGRVDLVGADSQLNVLVGLLSSVDRVTGAIPILGNVLGGTLIALPVSVNGDIRDPRVVPLGRHAVSDRLLGIFERTLKLPGKLVAPSDGQKPATGAEGR